MLAFLGKIKKNKAFYYDFMLGNSQVWKPSEQDIISCYKDVSVVRTFYVSILHPTNAMYVVPVSFRHDLMDLRTNWEDNDRIAFHGLFTLLI